MGELAVWRIWVSANRETVAAWSEAVTDVVQERPEFLALGGGDGGGGALEAAIREGARMPLRCRPSTSTWMRSRRG
jgi:hypothetical protein